MSTTDIAAAAKKRLPPDPPPVVRKRLLTPAQTAELLGVTEQTLAHWRSTDRVHLPFVSISRRCVRYTQDAVDAFIASRTVA